MGIRQGEKKKKNRLRKHDSAQSNIKCPPLLPSRQSTRTKAKPVALLIKAKVEKGIDRKASYATIATTLKEKVDLTELGVTVKRTRMT